MLPLKDPCAAVAIIVKDCPSVPVVGTTLLIVTEPLLPGASVNEVAEKDVVQPEGWVLLKVKRPVGHGLESPFRTVTV